MYNITMNPRNNNTLEVKSLLLVDSGTYDTVYSSPYKMNVTQEMLNDIRYRVDNSSSAVINPNTISGAVSGIMLPYNDYNNQVVIPYGWNERRLRFIMEVEITSNLGVTDSFMLQGYTEYCGVTNTSIDPNMPFHINSYMRFKRWNQNMPTGMIPRTMVNERAIVLNGNSNKDLYAGNNYTLRPLDVVNNIQREYLDRAFKDYSQDTIFDYRTTSNNYVLSDLRNNIPTNYVASTLKAFNNGAQSLGVGEGDSNIYAKTADQLREPDTTLNPVLGCIAWANGNLNSTSFTMSTLSKLDPLVNKKTNYITIGNAVNTSLPQAGQTDGWAGANLETQFAKVISNSLPALMVDNMLKSITLASTNDSIGAVMCTTPIDYQAFTDGDLRQNFANLIQRFETEVMYDLTRGNQIVYHVNVKASVFEDTIIDISVNGSPLQRFNVPTFCNGLFAPVVTRNIEDVRDTNVQMETLLNGVIEPNYKLPIL